jgi:hypothetical protein
MAKYKVEWSIEARLDLIDILEFYIIRNKSTLYSKKLVTIFALRLDSFILKKTYRPFTSSMISALDKSYNRDNFIFRRDWQKLRHGDLPTGTASRLKHLDRWPDGLRHQRFLLIPAGR